LFEITAPIPVDFDPGCAPYFDEWFKRPSAIIRAIISILPTTDILDMMKKRPVCTTSFRRVAHQTFSYNPQRDEVIMCELRQMGYHLFIREPNGPVASALQDRQLIGRVEASKNGRGGR